MMTLTCSELTRLASMAVPAIRSFALMRAWQRLEDCSRPNQALGLD
jgi:hypothetical protein